MPLNGDHLRYFRALVEGERVEGWHLWWANHHAELADLPRTQFLKLKFERVKHAAEVLTERGVAFSWSRRGRLAAAFANYVPEALDELGFPRPEFTRKAYRSILAALDAGDFEKAKKALGRKIRTILKGSELTPSQGLAEYEWDAENLYRSGETAAALLILDAVASLPQGDDLLDPAIHAAANALDRVRSGELGP